jgi:cell division cycle 20-like protein 1 (cofactor of APC complex)
MDRTIGSDAYNYVPRTPSPKRRNTPSKAAFSDRLIPSRTATNFACGWDLWETSENTTPSNTESTGVASSSPASLEKENCVAESFDNLLRSELLGTPPKVKKDADSLGSSETNNFFQYKAELENVPLCHELEITRSPVPLRINEHPLEAKAPHRKIVNRPYKVLDAAAIRDDFYLNLLEWSAADDVAVGLGSSVYLWNATTCRVSKLCDLGYNCVTSVAWTSNGSALAVGSSCGDVQIWDAEQTRKLRTMEGHQGNVNTCAWAGYILSTGGQDGCIIQRDVRQASHSISKVDAQSSQVCNLKWSPDEQHLASGSNDCKIHIWSLHSKSPLLECTRCQSAVKGLAWSPHQAGLLASGGGVADKCIRIWNTRNDSLVKCVDTGSQVCNLIWSKNVNEIVSTHGYSMNEVAIWKYPSLTPIAKLTGHARRVLFLGMSPDGRRIVTGSGDETLRFWDAFPAVVSGTKSSLASMLPQTIR